MDLPVEELRSPTAGSTLKQQGVPWGRGVAQPPYGQKGRAACVWFFPSEKASKAEFYLDVQWVFKHVEPSEFTGK